MFALLAQGTAIVCFPGRQSDAVAHCLGRLHNDATRRLDQYALLQDPQRKLRLARLLLQRKLHAQERALHTWLQRGQGNRSVLLRALQEMRKVHRWRSPGQSQQPKFEAVPLGVYTEYVGATPGSRGRGHF